MFLRANKILKRVQKWRPFTVALLLLCARSGVTGQTTQQITTTLLPENSSQLLWVQENPKKEIMLKFKLSELPRGMPETSFVRCTLRLVAEQAVFDKGKPNTGGEPVIVKGRVTTAAANAPSIVSLSPISETPNKPIALQATDALRHVVYQSYASNQAFSITLSTESHKASSTFYSLNDYSNAPRLVIEYNAPPPSLLESFSWPQDQHDPEHTGRNPWVPFSDPAGFTIEKIEMQVIAGPKGTIVDYPLIYGGNLYLIVANGGINYLTCLSFNGKQKLWEKDIGRGTVQRSPLISPRGVIYVVTEGLIAGYNLESDGKIIGSYALPGKLSNYTNLMAGNDGSLFLALKENALNYIYGFTSDLRPFLKSGPFDKNISTVTASTDGKNVFAQTNKGAVVIDVANPSNQQTVPIPNAWEYYHVPVAGPARHVMIFSDFTGTANEGNVWGYDSAEIWKSLGTLIPQPVLGNDVVYFIQGGKLRGHKYNQHGDSYINAGDGLSTSSNLVMDGANNIYFWSNGELYGYKPDGTVLFANKAATDLDKERQGDGPEKFIRLMMGPDGTLWANNKAGTFLYAFKPIYAKPELTVTASGLKNQTVYRATNTLSVTEGDVTLKTGTVTVFQAGSGIVLHRGFKVEKGACLLCRTGR
jgi:hypothetical protein